MKCGVAGHALVAINLHKKDAKSLLYLGLLDEGKIGRNIYSNSYNYFLQNFWHKWICQIVLSHKILLIEK